MKAEREQLDMERMQMADQLAKLQEQSRREVTAWGDAQAADKGRLDALAAQLEGLRNVRTALSEEREAMAQERKKLQKIRKQQQQQQEAAAAIHDDEEHKKVPASVVQKRMQRQWAAQRQAYERLERLIHDANGNPRRGSAAAAKKGKGSPSAGALAKSGAVAHRRRRRRRKRPKSISAAGAPVAGSAIPAAEGVPRWREVSLREQLPVPPPSMLFSVGSLGLPDSSRPIGGKHEATAGAVRRCARRAAAMEARLEGFDAATF